MNFLNFFIVHINKVLNNFIDFQPMMEISIIFTMVEFVVTVAELFSDGLIKIQKSQIFHAGKIEEEIVVQAQVKIKINAELMSRLDDNANYVAIDGV